MRPCACCGEDPSHTPRRLPGLKVAPPSGKSREKWSCEIGAKAAPVVQPITKALSKRNLRSNHLSFTELVKQLCGDLIRFTFEYLGGWTGRRRLMTEHFRRRIRADL